MKPVSLFLDEDVRVLVAEVLRQRGYDAVHVVEVNRDGIKDSEQLAFAADQGRAILTQYSRLSVTRPGLSRAGATPCRHHRFRPTARELLRRILRCLNQRSREDLDNQVVWLHAFKS